MTPALDLSPKFYCQIQDEQRGPYDQVELAGQLRCAEIEPGTSVCREGEETWLPLRELPEFTSIRDMPIETIARHLEDKAHPPNAKSFLPSQKSIGFFLAGLFLLVLIALLVRAPGSASSAPTSSVNANSPPQWTRTADDDFSIESPVALNRTSSTSGELESIQYEADWLGVHYGVQMVHFNSALPDSMFDRLLEGARDKLLDSPGRTFISQRFLTVYGHRGLDLVYTDVAGGITYDGGARILLGDKKVGVAQVSEWRGSFSSGDVKRCLDSFEVY